LVALGDLRQKAAFLECRFQYAEKDRFSFLVCTFYTVRIASFTAFRSTPLFYAIEF
jgi:hypothetical protein